MNIRENSASPIDRNGPLKLFKNSKLKCVIELPRFLQLIHFYGFVCTIATRIALCIIFDRRFWYVRWPDMRIDANATFLCDCNTKK